MNLYELTQEEIRLNALLDIEERTPEQEQELCDLFDQLEENKTAKADGYIKVIRNTQAMIDMADGEIRRLSALNDRRKDKLEYLRNRVIMHLRMTGNTNLEGNLGKFTLRAGKKKVNIIDIMQIPQKYVKFEQLLNPDKVAIADAIKSGETVDGCELIDGECGLSLK